MEVRMDTPYFVMEMSLPDSVWEKLEAFEKAPPEVFYGAVAWYGHPEYAQEAFSRFPPEEIDNMLRRVVLRSWLASNGYEPNQSNTLGLAFAMSNGFDYRLE
jgi:hypothetical protein